MVKYQNVSYANQLCIVIGHKNVLTEMNLCSYLKKEQWFKKTTPLSSPPPLPLAPSVPPPKGFTFIN